MLAAFLKCIYAAWLLYWLFFENSIHTLALLLDWEAVELVLNQIRFAGKIKVSLLLCYPWRRKHIPGIYFQIIKFTVLL